MRIRAVGIGPGSFAIGALALAVFVTSCAGTPSPEPAEEPVPEPPRILSGPSVPTLPGLEPVARYAGPFAVEYLGNSTILVMGPDGSLVVCDPYSPGDVPYGLTPLPSNLVADAVTVSHAHGDHDSIRSVFADPRVIAAPGSYQVGAIKVTGFPGLEGSPRGPSRMSNVIFVIEADGAKIVHLGDSGPVTDPAVLEAVSDADLVVVNIDMYVITKPDMMPFLDRIRARTILPSHYPVFAAKPDVDDFLALLPAGLPVERTGSRLVVAAGGPRRIVVMRAATQKEP
ncbi:MAG: MBL fold metallo-hydrolase [Spirochaetes bacterium]|nr:MBL fold metallo-hydrolase [Spirochaetota bacterium]